MSVNKNLQFPYIGKADMRAEKVSWFEVIIVKDLSPIQFHRF